MKELIEVDVWELEDEKIMIDKTEIFGGTIDGTEYEQIVETEDGRCIAFDEAIVQWVQIWHNYDDVEIKK